MEVQSDKEYHRKALALLVCFFIAFLYVETVARPFYAPQSMPSKAGDATQQGDAGVSAATGQPVASAQPGVGGQAVASPQTGATTIAAAPTNVGYPLDAQIAERGIIAVKTDKFTAKLSLLGGRLTELRLSEYREFIDPQSNGLNLVHHGGQVPFPLGLYSGPTASDIWTEYAAVSGVPEIPAGANEVVVDLSNNSEAQTIVLAGKLADGREVKKTLTFTPGSYFIDINADIAADQTGQPLALEWVQFIAEQDTSLLDMYNVPGFVWFDGQKALRKTVQDFTEASQDFGPVSWVSIGDKYFAGVLISPDAPALGRAMKLSGEQLYRTRIEGSPTAGTFKVYVGPKSYKMLQHMGYELQRIIEFGMFGVVAGPLLSLLYALYGLFGNYGLAIVVLTILVKLALYPLNSASYKQMKAMQDLKPEMDRIREQFKDKQDQQMQLMALYKKHGVNPVGGCLPILLQMPIFIGLYSGLMLAVELRHAHFGLWINDLSGPEQLMLGGIGIPVMVILFVISMIVQQATTPTQMDPVQKKMMMAMPLVLGFMFASMPSGLTLYWLTSNLISIGQQKGLQGVHNDGKKSGLQVTLGVSFAVFVLAYLVSLF